MTWGDCYRRLYDWAGSTQISRMAAIENFSDAEGYEVVEVAMSFSNEAAATRLVKKALDEGVHFTAEDVVDVLEYISGFLRDADYGYRYGRWYYGHNHVRGCQFGGNKNP